jgi:hypothetical protein
MELNHSNTMKELLDNLPSGCPLPSAVDCASSVFLIFPDEEISALHCLSQAERGRARNATGDAACTRHGLSVFPSVESCIHQRKLLPHLGRFIGSAWLGPDHGKIAETPSSTNPAHMTWWPYKNTPRHTLFHILEGA